MLKYLLAVARQFTTDLKCSMKTIGTDRLGGCPDVIVGVSGLFVLAALEERMLFAGVIGIDFEHNFDALLVKRLDDTLERFQVADLAVDSLEVGHVSAQLILTSRLKDGAEDDGAAASDQVDEVIQLLNDACQVADSIAVRILECANVGAVDDGSLPPLLIRTRRTFRREDDDDNGGGDHSHPQDPKEDEEDLAGADLMGEADERAMTSSCPDWELNHPGREWKDNCLI